MSRPLHFLVPATCAALSLGFSACVGTIYDPVYSNRVTHYKPPVEKKEASAADLLAEAEARKAMNNMPAEAAPGMAPAADPGIPGLTPPPGDAAMPAVPGGAPAAPPPVPPPPL